jgi:hypothetical protein
VKTHLGCDSTHISANLSFRHYEAARLNRDLGKEEEALQCSSKGLVIDQSLFGVDHTPNSTD